MPDLKRKVAIVTGASSGIGRAIALRLAREGVRLGLVARNETRLEAVAEEARGHTDQVRCYTADLAREEDWNSLKLSVDADFSGIDILIHAAGMATRGTVEEAPVRVFSDHLQINTVAPFALTHLFLPSLRRHRGQVVFINSRAGLHAFAGLSHYCASKFALRAFADALREEVRGDNVRVLSVYPGKVETPMLRALQTSAGRPFEPGNYLQPDDVAEMVVSALRMPPQAEVTDITVRPQADTSLAPEQKEETE